MTSRCKFNNYADELLACSIGARTRASIIIYLYCEIYWPLFSDTGSLLQFTRV